MTRQGEEMIKSKSLGEKLKLEKSHSEESVGKRGNATNKWLNTCYEKCRIYGEGPH